MAENAEIIRSTYEAFARGDIAAVLETVHERAEWDVTETLPQGGSYRGRQEVGQFFATLDQTWDEFDVELDDLIAMEGHVVAIGHVEGTLSEGSPASYGFAHVFTMRDGKISRFREYAAPDELLRDLNAA